MRFAAGLSARVFSNTRHATFRDSCLVFKQEGEAATGTEVELWRPAGNTRGLCVCAVAHKSANIGKHEMQT